ncbi:uncharacterized protein LOC110466770 [Mizuhopecten yessoensis]|uniref:Zinc finger CCCH domain-containing protein 3 n=1 Tax=Mizuhopecten yessoensis TaxID=6573 RepID=A0A210PNJ7_MIZYE|nr:uncharacterized protein LOC110466770 [Mizuhopecten yessoensis]XP_021379194.1 uncharacterized protein LOC110466770 [Mizuhopecten yessoensis]XP_021379195.1 uncharacterized protein LOC110466770 [Mizuhopecten yessoensis]OWF38016.1 Zinc finger CCCH domain-containing protein 3 [Mizuhopecten yessoensis]
MSKTSEADTLKSQIKYLTDLINNANKRKQGTTTKKTLQKASIEVVGHQQRTGPHHHVHHTKTDLQRLSTGHGQQPQCQKYTVGHQKETQKSLKHGKYVWMKNTAKPSAGEKQEEIVITPGLNQGTCFSTGVGSSSKSLSSSSSKASIRGNNRNDLADSSTVSRKLVSKGISDGVSLHSQTVKSVLSTTAASKQISCIQNISSNIVYVPAPHSSSSSTADVSSSGLKSIRSQLVHKLKGTVSSSVKSASNLQSNSSTSSSSASNKEGKSSLQSSTHTKRSSNDIPPLLKSQLSSDSSQKIVSQTPSSVSSTKKSSGDKDVILFTVQSKSPGPVEQNIKREFPQTQEKLSVIPSFLKNRLSRKMSKEVGSLLTSTNTVRKVDPESKMEKSTPSLPSSESEHLQSSRVPSSGEFIVHSEKETILPQNRFLGAKSSSQLSKEFISQDTMSSALSAVETTSVCQVSQQLSKTAVSHSPGTYGPGVASTSQLLGAGGMKQPASLTKSSTISAESIKLQPSSLEQLCPSKESTVSSVCKTFTSNQSTAANPSKLPCTKGDQSKSSIPKASSPGAKTSISVLSEMNVGPFKGEKALLSGSSESFTNKGYNVTASGSQTKSPKTGLQASVSSPTSSPQKSSQPSQMNNTSSPSKTFIVEKTDSRKDTVLQLSEKLAKTQAEIKRMTRNITNGQVTMKSIAAIKKEKSASATQSHQTKVKLLQGAKSHKPQKMYGQDSSKGPRFPIRKGQTFPCRLNSSKFNSQIKRSSKSLVVFDKKYSLNKKVTAPFEKPGESLPQTTRSVLTPSKTQVVAKVIKSKYKLWKVTSGVKTPPPHYDSKSLIFPKKTFPSSRGYSFPSNYNYHAHWGRGRGWGNPYGYSSYPYLGLRKHQTYPGTKDRPGYYTRHAVPKGMYPVTGSGSYHLFTPQKFKRPQFPRSKVIFDRKYVLKRLQHDRSSPSSFKLDKRRPPLSVPPGACGVSSVLQSRLTSTLQPTRTPGKSSFVVINGMLYKSSSKSLVRTSPVKSVASSTADSFRNSSIVVKKMQSKSMKLVTVRGVQFQMDAGGKTLRRVNSPSITQGDSRQSQTTVKRLDIGGVTFVRNSQGALERVGSANTRVVANRVIHKSIAAATARYRKSNTLNKLSKQYCLFFNRFGKCKRGDKCPYIHDPDKVAVCTRFLRGTCRMTGCPFSHKVVKEKMPVCSYFLRGVCNRDNCPYLHVKVNKNASICQNFVKGFCPLGEKCKKQHTLECPVFGRTGQCPARRTCPLIHKTRKEKPRRKRSMATTVGEPQKELDEPTLKRTATDSGITEMEDNTSGVPFKLQKLPTFISLGSSTETQTQTPAVKAIRIKPKL